MSNVIVLIWSMVDVEKKCNAYENSIKLCAFSENFYY